MKTDVEATTIAYIKNPKPYEGCTYYVQGWTGKLYERKGWRVLVDGPTIGASNPAERTKVWVPASCIAWTMDL